MEIHCPNCKTTLSININDVDTSKSFVCPSCKKCFVVEPTESKNVASGDGKLKGTNILDDQYKVIEEPSSLAEGLISAVASIVLIISCLLFLWAALAMFEITSSTLSTGIIFVIALGSLFPLAFIFAFTHILHYQRIQIGQLRTQLKILVDILEEIKHK
jgi:hypothetical protein